MNISVFHREFSKRVAKENSSSEDRWKWSIQMEVKVEITESRERCWTTAYTETKIVPVWSKNFVRLCWVNPKHFCAVTIPHPVKILVCKVSGFVFNEILDWKSSVKFYEVLMHLKSWWSVIKETLPELGRNAVTVQHEKYKKRFPNPFLFAGTVPPEDDHHMNAMW